MNFIKLIRKNKTVLLIALAVLIMGFVFLLLMNTGKGDLAWSSLMRLLSPPSPVAGLLVLMYHDISLEPPTEAELMAITTTADKFAEDIDTLLELGYKPISLEDYYYGRVNAKQKYFIVTFDDGYVGVHDFAYPVLLEKQVPACVFFNTGMEIYDTFLSFGQLWHMEKSGLINVYSHLEYHVKATEMPVEDFVDCLDTSLTKLRRFLWEENKFLAYPYGDYNRETYRAAQEYGVKLQLVQKMQFPAADILVRVNVAYDTDMRKLVKKAPRN
ncbi:MAG: polysaccharide deacetylase family protein [Clostridiales bacterium]|nr:polysaccharide deacetylase family protein [Clostridiales bacterium]